MKLPIRQLPTNSARRPARQIALGLGLAALATLSAPAAARPRVVAIGFDGADAALTRRLIDEGKLPNLARLEREGSFQSLATTNPPQTPVSWSSFATGLNPGRTTIFDFLKRDAKSYIPLLALNEETSRPFLMAANNRWLGAGVGLLLGFLVLGAPLAIARRTRRLALVAGLVAGVAGAAGGFAFARRYLPEQVPWAVNNRQGATFWDLAAARGLKTRILRLPATFPATEVAHGEFLSGLGVPDIRGTVGTFSFYTTERLEKSEDTEFGGKVVELDPFERQTSTVVYGPRNRLFYNPDPRTRLDPEGDPKEINLPLLLTRDGDKVTIEVSGNRLSLAPGQWSDWVVFTFAFNPFIKLRGMGRFHLVSSEPLKLYLSPINLHPDRPPVPISSPPDYAAELMHEHGLYKTLGWEEDTWSYTEKRIDEEIFFQDVEDTVRKDEEIMLAELKKGDFDVFVQVFTFTDRVSHVFWRLTDPEHPAYDAKLATRYANSIDQWYERMDQLVGKAMEAAAIDSETLFLVLSDHGFASWRRSVNYNTWLVKNGYMTLYQSLGGRQLTLEDLFGNKKFWPYVDWSRTKAYSLGLGNIYINLKGREPQGSVAPGAEYEAVMGEIQRGLEALVDPKTGESPVRKVYRREDMYLGFDPDVIPDLRVANNPGYRVSWQSSLGATPPEVFEDNTKPWSADHCSLDPAAVPGILFMNRRPASSEAAIVDVMPTILRFVGVEPPPGLDGKPLL